MPKDYAKRGQFKVRKRRHSRTIPWLSILFLVVFLAMVVMGVYFLREHYDSLHPPVPSLQGGAVVRKAKPVSEVSVNPNGDVDSESQTQEPVKFDFYNQLPEMKINSNSSSNSVPATTNSQASASSFTPNPAPQDQASANEVSMAQSYSKYFLQLASLTTQTSAEAFEASLKSKGVKSDTVIANRGSLVFYRVQIGPFGDIQGAKAMQDQLQQKHISSILIKS